MGRIGRWVIAAALAGAANAHAAPISCTGGPDTLSSEQRQIYESLAARIAADPFYRAIAKRFGAPRSCARASDADAGLRLVYRFAGGRLTTRAQPEIELSERRLDWRGLSESNGEQLLRAEEKAAISGGCGIAWAAPTTETSGEGASHTVVYRGGTCNCQAGKLYEGSALIAIFFRSAC